MAFLVVIKIPVKSVTILYLFRLAPFVKTKSQNQIFSKLVVWKRKIFLHIDYKFLRRNFLTCHSYSYYRFMMVDSITIAKVGCAILLLVLTFCITLLPYKLKNIGESNLKTVKCLCGGVSSFLQFDQHYKNRV